MLPKILITSFQTWLPHQKSNSSDDLLGLIQPEAFSFASLILLRQLPVEVESASQKVIATIKEVQPQAIICCGMAESRPTLTIESNATYGDKCLLTLVDLPSLLEQLQQTKISHNAGKFVCEGLYYHILQYLRQIQVEIPCIFVHVPVFKPENRELICQDFRAIVKQMSIA